MARYYVRSHREPKVETVTLTRDGVPKTYDVVTNNQARRLANKHANRDKRRASLRAAWAWDHSELKLSIVAEERDLYIKLGLTPNDVLEYGEL